MSRLRARNKTNTAWIDICQSEWFIRNPSNTAWMRITPAQGIRARHGAEKYWLDIDCIADETAVCGEDQYGGTEDGKGTNGSGAGLPLDGGGDGGGPGGGGDDGGGGGSWPNYPGWSGYDNPDNGSGQGGGDGYSDDGGYVPGYDLPDSGGPGAGLDDSGDCIRRPGLGTCEPYNEIPGEDCENAKFGSLECPVSCPDTISGSGKGIWEFYVEMGSEEGPVNFTWAAKSGASFDVYYRGKLMASTGGRRVGQDVMNFVYQPAAGVTTILVRVRTSVDAATWMFQASCPNSEPEDGNLVDPRPCVGTFLASSDSGKAEYFHDMGTEAGEVVINYQMWNQPDRMDVYDWRGNLIATTGGFVAGEGFLTFDFTPSEHNLVRVRITARDPGPSWTYLITCPGEMGSKLKPRPCDDDSPVQSGGAGVTDTFIDLGTEAGEVGIRYQMWYVPDKMDVYQNGTLVATTGGYVLGDNWLYFYYNPNDGTEINVRVTGEGFTTWLFLHTCPGENKVEISVDDPEVLEGSEDSPGSLCWTVSLNQAPRDPVHVDYATVPGSANPIVAQGKILATDTLNNPFIAVVDAPDVGRALFDGGFPKFYNSKFTPPQNAPEGPVVFDSWPRTSAGDYYTSLSSIPANSEARQWELTAAGDIRCTVNSARLLTFLSPGTFNNYTFAATLTSNDGDDDMIGLVVASTRVGTTLFQLLATRHCKGMPQFGSSFSLCFVINGSVSRVVATKNMGTKSGWSGAKSRVEARKECGVIDILCSAFGSTEIDEASRITFDLSTDDELNGLFNQETNWGFCTFSQRGSSYEDIFLSGIGLPSNFTFLKNAALWAKGSGSSVALICDKAAGGDYTLDSGGNGFGIGIVETLKSVGMTTALIHGPEVYAGLSEAELAGFDLIIFMATNTGAAMPQSSATNIVNRVANGAGLIVITDHDVFQKNANMLAQPFNVEFYGDINRTSMPVAGFIQAHGEHEVWDGMRCDTIFGGGSEGAIRLRDVRSDYKPVTGTVVFNPGETSKQVCVELIGNSDVDPDRDFFLELTNPIGATLEKDKGKGTIIDDDEGVCADEATLPVYARGNTTGPHGSDHMHVQEVYNCAAGNTHYAMRTKLDFPETGAYVFNFQNDDDFELFIDCEKVAHGPIGSVSKTIQVQAGTRDLILRYLNVPDCTPGYASFSIVRNASVFYITKAADWKGLAKPLF